MSAMRSQKDQIPNPSSRENASSSGCRVRITSYGRADESTVGEVSFERDSREVHNGGTVLRLCFVEPDVRVR